MHLIPLDPNLTLDGRSIRTRLALVGRCVYAAGMPEKERTVQKPVRMPESWGPRLKALAEKLGETGIPVSEAAVIRLALVRGLDALETEHRLAHDGADAPDPRETGERRPARRPKPKK